MMFSSKHSFGEMKQIFFGSLLTLLLALMISQPVHAETVNINKADAATLQYYLSGVGEVKAKAIVAYRKKHGKFKTVDDLIKVPGIGEATLKKNRKRISTSRGITRLDSNKKNKASKATKAGKSKS